jgi:hypothetical protein
MGLGQFVDEARGQRRLPQIVHAAVLRKRDDGAALGAGDADIGEAAFLLEPGAALLVERALVREEAFLPAGQEHGAELQPLGGMQRHDGDLILFRRLLGLHDERDVFEEAREVLELAHRAHQFLEVLEPALRLRALVGLQHLGVARFIEHDFGEFGVRNALHRLPPAAEAVEQPAQRGARLGRKLVGSRHVFGGAIE